MTSNILVPDRYDERIVRLALGVEPLDAITGARVATGLRVLLEDAPAPLHAWRTWRPGETLDDVLPPLDRHPTGRFGRIYDRRFVGGSVVFRLIEPAAGRRPVRHVVPRRCAVDLADEATVAAADAGPTGPHPLWRRVFPLGLFPGAAADLPALATVARGRVLSGGEPVRWARVRAVDATGDVVGWAHGDDRGEFVLVVGHPATAVVVPDDPLEVELFVGATLPPPAPDPLDPLRAVVDPLWDLPVEPLLPTPTPATSDRLAGRVLLPGQTTSGPFPVALPLGRQSTVSISIP